MNDQKTHMGIVPKNGAIAGFVIEQRTCACGCGRKFKVTSVSPQRFASLACSLKDATEDPSAPLSSWGRSGIAAGRPRRGRKVNLEMHAERVRRINELRAEGKTLAQALSELGIADVQYRQALAVVGDVPAVTAKLTVVPDPPRRTLRRRA